MAGSAALEYFTSWMLEKLFHACWWDYSRAPLNLNGRICFPVAIGFGLAGLFVLRVIYPFVDYMTGLIPAAFLHAVAFAFLFGFVLDLLITVCALSGFPYARKTRFMVRQRIPQELEPKNKWEYFIYTIKRSIMGEQ